MRSSVVVVLLTLAGCGYTDAGDGSKTLVVVADAVYSASEDNQLRVDVTVSKDGVGVTGATVKFTDGESGDVFTVPPHGGQDGRYRGDLTGYHHSLAIEVDSGDDNLEAQLEGPGTHVIAEPVNGARLTRDDVANLDIEWEVSDGIRADKVHIEIGDNVCTTTEIEETGSLTLPCKGLPAGSSFVRVRRSNQISLEGGVGESNFELSYQVTNQIVVE